MWFGKQIYCLAAFMATEVFAMALMFFSILGYYGQSTMEIGPLTPKAMIIGAYTAMIGVIIGGVIQVLQLVVNSKASKLEGVIREKDIRDQADKEARIAIDAARSREMELVKAQAEILRQQTVWLQGWQTTILNQKPGEPYGTSPTFHPDPNTSTPQAIEQARTLPLTANPVINSHVPPVVPVPPDVLKTSGPPNIFVQTGTGNAAVKENTEAVRENTEAVREATENL